MLPCVKYIIPVAFSRGVWTALLRPCYNVLVGTKQAIGERGSAPQSASSAASSVAEALLAREPDADLKRAFEHEPRLPFVADVYRKLFVYGSISQKQRDAVVRAVRFPFEREVSKESRRKEFSSDGTPDVEPLPVGNFVNIEGVVRKVQERDTTYGTRMAIVVGGKGWAVWGYAPRFQNVDLATGDLRDADLYDLVGERVRFYADVEASERDKSFGFSRRPKHPEPLYLPPSLGA